MEIEQCIWGFSPNEEAVVLYTLRNASGAELQLTNLGAAIVSVRVPDREGHMADVALGYRDFMSYKGDSAAMGKSVGRSANRIGRGQISIDGQTYQLSRNKGRNHLHGGAEGFADRFWEGRVEGNRVVFLLQSPDGDQGYPGNLTAEVAYFWDDDCSLEITYAAETDAPTIVNLTNHIYFNLAGESSGNIHGHLLRLNASHFLPTDSEHIPDGRLLPVEGTPMDFRQEKPIGRDINQDYIYLKQAGGYDQCWAVDGWKKNILSEVGVLTDPVSGRNVTILSSQPGVQIYTGNFLGGSPVGHSGRPYEDRDGVAIECQAFPDAPNHPNFPSTILRPGERYIQKIVYRFGVTK